MKWSKHKRNFIIFDFIMIIILISIDQYTKHLAVLNLKDKPAFSIIDGVFELNYLENRGAAFGMLQNQKGFFILISCITSKMCSNTKTTSFSCISCNSIYVYRLLRGL